jgi:hypothetical protein
MSRRRACAITAIGLLVLCLLGPFLAPYAAYTIPNYFNYRVNLAKWRGHSPSRQAPSYSAAVYVNQPDTRLYGENIIEVKDGRLADSEPLNVDGLFSLIRYRPEAP